VERRAGDRLRESYRWPNRGGSPLQIASLALSTPWRDVYAADGVAQETAVHTHVSASGAQAWTLAKPMHGQGPLLGLVVREGSWPGSRTRRPSWPPPSPPSPSPSWPPWSGPRSTSSPDPLDNDQDWALAYALRSGLVP
jgi:hypothetical protein